MKNNIRSIRFSDELLDIINAQVGDNFNQRFERLIYNCYMLLPEKERQLKELDAQIAQREQELSDLSRRFARAKHFIGCMESRLVDIDRLFGLYRIPEEP